MCDHNNDMLNTNTSPFIPDNDCGCLMDMFIDQTPITFSADYMYDDNTSGTINGTMLSDQYG